MISLLSKNQRALRKNLIIAAFVLGDCLSSKPDSHVSQCFLTFDTFGDTLTLSMTFDAARSSFHINSSPIFVWISCRIGNTILLLVAVLMLFCIPPLSPVGNSKRSCGAVTCANSSIVKVKSRCPRSVFPLHIGMYIAIESSDLSQKIQ